MFVSYMKYDRSIGVARASSRRALEKTIMKRVPSVRWFELSGENPEGEVCYAITEEEYGKLSAPSVGRI